MGLTAASQIAHEIAAESFELPPRLLVPVRSMAEMEAAIVGGADILDLPLSELCDRQSTGEPLWQELIHYAALRAPFTGISVSLGELTANSSFDDIELPHRVRWVRFDLSNTAHLSNWQEFWMLRRLEVEMRAGHTVRWLATVNLEHAAAQSPAVLDVLQAAEKTGCAGVWLNVNTPASPACVQGVSPLVWTDLARRTREKCLPLFIGGHVERDDIDWLCDLEPFVVQASFPAATCSESEVAHWKSALESAVLTSPVVW